MKGRIVKWSVLLFLIFYSLLGSAQGGLDSLFKITENKKDTAAALAYYEIGKKIASQSLDSSIQYFLKGDSISRDLNFTNGKIFNWRSLGSVYGRTGQHEKALSILDEGLEMIEQQGLPLINKVDFLINKGAAHYFAGLTGQAIETYIEAVEIARKEKYEAKRSMLLNNLGIFYRSLDRHEEAIQIYKESYDIRKLNADSSGMANIAHNMAVAYGKVGEYEAALGQITQAKQIYEQLGASSDVALCELATGTFLVDLNRHDEAEKYLLPLTQMDLKLEPVHHFNLYCGLAKIYLNKSRYSAALSNLNRIESEIMTSDLASSKESFNQLKAKALEGLGRHAEANKYLHQYIDISEERAKSQGQRLLKEMETKYLSNEKDNKISVLNVQKEISDLKLDTSNQRNIGLAIGLGLFGLLSFLLFQTNRKVQAQNKLISKANKEKSILLKEIHHRVKNNLQVVSSLLGLQSRFVQDNSALEAINTGRARVQSMSLLHQNVYRNENLKSVNIRKYFNDLGNNLFTNYKLNNKEITFETDIDDLELDIDVVVPMGLVTNELISNALKYGFVGRETGTIQLIIKQQDENILLIVKDNGVGIPFTTLPERSTSLGMQLVKSFAHKLNARVKIENNEGAKIQLIFNPSELVIAAA